MITCRGSIKLGSACGKCVRCKEEKLVIDKAIFDMKTPKECLDEMVALNQEMGLYDEPVAMCSCNARVKYKCSEESDSGCGKMCLKEKGNEE